MASDRLGARIRRLRRDRNLTLDQLAASSGVSRGTLSNIERGNQNPSLIAVVRIAVAFDLSTAQLIGEEPGPSARHIDTGQLARFVDSTTGYERHLYPAFRGEPFELVRHLIPPGVTSELLDPHEPGTEKYIYAENGLITVTVGHDQYPMRPGDALQFPADRPHRFANPGDVDASFLLIKLPRRPA